MHLLLAYLLSAVMMLDSSGKLSIQLPDSLLGRKICMATRMVEISDPGEAVAGQLSESCIPLCFIRKGAYIEMQQLVPFQEDSCRAVTVRKMKALPSPKGTVKVDVTELFLSEYRGLGTFPVGAYNSSGGSVMRTHNPISGQCRVESVFNDEAVCGAVCNMYYSMDAHLYGVMKVQGDFFLNCRVAKFFFVPEGCKQALVGKSDIFGAKTITLQTEAKADRPIENKEYLLRRDLSKNVVFHVDTLMPASWKSGIHRALEQWNKGFEAAGLGRPLLASDMGKSDSVLSDSFIYVPSGMDRYECTLLYDTFDGVIYSSSIVLHSNYIDKLCKEYVVQTAASDSRVRTCGDLPEDVMSDIVMAAVMPAIGRSMGLTENPAASFHGRTEDLLNPVYTAVYGVAGSAMETPVFNYLASESDRAKGVSLIQDCLSPYDIMALKTLYGRNAESCDIPYSTAKDSEGRFVPWAVRGDLSAEPVEALTLAGKRQSELMNSIDEWFTDCSTRDAVAASARAFYARLIVRLTDYLTVESDRGPSHREVVKCTIRQLRGLDWMKDEPAQTMYRTNVFRQMCQRACKAETLGMIYDELRPDEVLWMDMLLTELESRAEKDADALVIIRKMAARSSNPLIRKRIENIL